MKNSILHTLNKKSLPIFLLFLLCFAPLQASTLKNNRTFSSIDLVTFIQDVINRITKKNKGAIVAKIEGKNIYKKDFNRELDLILKNTSSSAAEIKKMKKNPRLLRTILASTIDSLLILKEIKTNKMFQKNSEFYVFLKMAIIESIKKYYLREILKGKVNTKVTDKEINNFYEKLRKNPRYSARLARLPFATVKKLLKQEIIKQRQKQIIQKVIEDLRGKYRFKIFDKALKK